MIKNTKKLKRVIATWVITAVMLSVFILDIFVNLNANNLIASIDIKDYSQALPEDNDKIHFLNTANSDCIIVESNGKFALIDSGEGNNNPRRNSDYKGFEKEVLSFIEKNCADKNGQIHFEFAVATHMHYDHSGNFEAIINHPRIKIGKLFIKEYEAQAAGKRDAEKWGNKKIYENILSAAQNNKIPIKHSIPSQSFDFGDFTLQFINSVTPDELKKAGENANSIGLKVSKGTKSAFLAADFTGDNGLEKYYHAEIGNIDLLKMGHHGYFGSSSKIFLEALKPNIAICTNYIGKIYPNVKWNLTMSANVPVFSTEQRNGITAVFTDKDYILLYENIM